MKSKVFAHASSIYSIDMSFYKKHDIRFLLIDLDNTLDSYKNPLPSENAINLINKLKENGITTFVISNNSKKRVKKYCTALNIGFLSRSFKPLMRKTKKFIKNNQIDIEHLAFVGDQIMTDVRLANKLGIKIVLTDKLTNKDQATTHFNRLFEKRHLERMKRDGSMNEWNEI